MDAHKKVIASLDFSTFVVFDHVKNRDTKMRVSAKGDNGSKAKLCKSAQDCSQEDCPWTHVEFAKNTWNSAEDELFGEYLALPRETSSPSRSVSASAEAGSPNSSSMERAASPADSWAGLPYAHSAHSLGLSHSHAFGPSLSSGMGYAPYFAAAPHHAHPHSATGSYYDHSGLLVVSGPAFYDAYAASYTSHSHSHSYTHSAPASTSRARAKPAGASASLSSLAGFSSPYGAESLKTSPKPLHQQEWLGQAKALSAASMSHIALRA
jgi:hypothetical protein